MAKLEEKVKRGSKARWFWPVMAVVVVFQVCLVICWGASKKNYHLNELMTMSYARNFTGVAGDDRYIFDRSDWQEGNIVSPAEIKTTFRLDPGQGILDQPFMTTLKLMVTQRNYYGFLNLAESLVHPGRFSRWGGLVFNVFCFILIQLLLIHFLGMLEADRIIIAAALCMFGCCGTILGLAVFIRFYLLTNLMILAVLDLHLVMWKNKVLWRQFPAEAAALFLMYLAFKNSELTLALSGSLLVFFTIGLLLKRRWLQSLLYFIPVAGFGTYYLSQKTEFIKLLLHPSSYIGIDGTKGMLAGHVLNGTFTDMNDYFLHRIGMWTVSEFFGSAVVLVGFILLIVVLALFGLKRRNKQSCSHLGDGGQFMILLLGVLTVYNLFMTMARPGKEDGSRYYSFGLLMLFLLIWYAMDRLWKKAALTGGTKGVILVVLFGLVLASVPIHAVRRDIRYTYFEDVPVIEKLREYQDLNQAILNPSERKTSYECVYLSPDDKQIYLVNRFFKKDIDNLDDEFILWVSNYKGTPYPGIARLIKHGYQVQKLGETHISYVYHVWR